MSKLIVTGLLFCLSFGIMIDVQARSSPYVLDVRVIKGDDENKLVRLKNKRSNRIIWTRKVYSPKVIWSKDQRAVAVEGAGHFLVWREGYKLRDFGVPAGRDYLMGCVWSPDKRRLLVRCGSSGSSDANMGSLFCLRLGTGNSYKYSSIAGGVFEMRWRGNRTVLYEALNPQKYEKGEAVAEPYVWPIP